MPDANKEYDRETRTKTISVDIVGEYDQILSFDSCPTCPGPRRTPTLHAGCHCSGIDKSGEDWSPANKGHGYICKVCGVELSSEQSLGGHLNVHKEEGVPSVTARSGGSDATSSLISWIIKKFAVVGGSTTGDNDAGSPKQVVLFQLQSKDLPSRRLLGKGLAGYGYETTWKGERFARKDFIGVPRNIFEEEAAVLIGLEHHKNIVKTYGWTADKRSCSLVLEYMDDDLLSLLEKLKQDLADIGSGSQSSTSTVKEPFDLPQAIDVMLQIAAGMEALHEQGIAHGDLKTKNILVSHANKRDQNMMAVKVADFGLVCSKRKSKFIVSRQVLKLDMVQWKAPEYLKVQFRNFNLSYDRDGALSESDSSSESESELEPTSTPPVVNVRLPGVDFFAADVYSFALTCFHVLTGNDPYPNLNWKELGFKILSGLRPNLPATCQPFLRDLLKSCWGDPAQRPNFSTIHMRLKHLHAALLIADSSVKIEKMTGIVPELDPPQLPQSQCHGHRRNIVHGSEEEFNSFEQICSVSKKTRHISKRSALVDVRIDLKSPGVAKNEKGNPERELEDFQKAHTTSRFELPSASEVEDRSSIGELETQATGLVDPLGLNSTLRCSKDGLSFMTESTMRGFVATLAARRIQRAFRNHNEKKQQLAASHFQQKFRSWKVRKDFLNLRQQVVRIQAHVRGNLVRRRFRKLRWSVGVLKKAILRWKRRRLGLQGFKSGNISADTKEDDEKFLKTGRKQAEKAVEKEVTGQLEERGPLPENAVSDSLSLSAKSPPRDPYYEKGAQINLNSTLRCSNDRLNFSIGNSHEGLEKDMGFIESSEFSVKYSNTCLKREPFSDYPSASTSFDIESEICSAENATDSRKADIVTLSLLSDTPCLTNTCSSSSTSTRSLLRSDIRWFSDTQAASSSDLNIILNYMSSKGRWSEEKASLDDHCVPESGPPRARPFLDIAAADISQTDGGEQVVDADYMELRHGGSSEAMMLTDELDSVLWVNSAFQRLSTERMNSRMQVTGPHVDPLGIRTHLATVRFQPPYPYAFKCKAFLWGFLKKFVFPEGGTHKQSNLSEGQGERQGQAKAKGLAPHISEPSIWEGVLISADLVDDIDEKTSSVETTVEMKVASNLEVSAGSEAVLHNCKASVRINDDEKLVSSVDDNLKSPLESLQQRRRVAINTAATQRGLSWQSSLLSLRWCQANMSERIVVRQASITRPNSPSPPMPLKEVTVDLGLKDLYKSIIHRVPWQAAAIAGIAATVLKCRCGGSGFRGQYAKTDTWLLLLGPDPMAKHAIAKSLAELVFGGERNLIHLGFAEGWRAKLEADDIGTRYRSRTPLDRLAEAVLLKSSAVVLLEDIDKADAVARSRVLRAMETGKLPDSFGREVSFSDTIVLMTTSVGSELFEPMASPGSLFFSEAKLAALVGRAGIRGKIKDSRSNKVVFEAPNRKVVVVDHGAERQQREPALESSTHYSPVKGLPFSVPKLKLEKRTKSSERFNMDLFLATDNASENTYMEGAQSPTHCEDDEEAELQKVLAKARIALSEKFCALTDYAVELVAYDFNGLATKVLNKLGKTLEVHAPRDVGLEVDLQLLEHIISCVWKMPGGHEAFNAWVDDVFAKALADSRLCGRDSIVELVAEVPEVEDGSDGGVGLPRRIVFESALAV